MAIEVSQKIYNYFSEIYGKQSADKYVEFISNEPTQYIRINLSKISRADLHDLLLKKYKINSEPLNQFENVLKISSGEDRIGKTIEHVLGFYYIQSLSSMMPPIVLNPSNEDTVMDLCGAPGSKSTQLAELMNNQGTLIINEIDNERIKSLVFNLERMMVLNASVIHSKGELLSKIYDNHFSKILVDAPCSGLGIIQKKGEVSNWWSLDHVDRLQQLQLRLLIAAIKIAKVGGEIVYSTCTLSIEENELVIDKILEKYPIQIEPINLPIPTYPAFTEFEGKKLNPELAKAIRILPWQINSDGFFLVKLIKYGETEFQLKEEFKKTEIRVVSSNYKEIIPLLKYVSEHFGIAIEVLNNFKYVFRNRDIYFVSKDWDDENIGLFNRIGLKFGTLDKKERLTFHSQAAQALEEHITSFIYTIKNGEELKNYLTGWKIKDLEISNGQYVVKYDKWILGTAIKTNEGLKSRFPRSKRTQKFAF